MTFAELGIEVPSGRRGNYKALCPQCSHTRRSKRDRCLSVNIDEGVWHCHNCAWSGSLGTTGGYGVAERRTYTAPAQRALEVSDGLLEWFAKRAIPTPVVVRNDISAGLEFCPIVGREVRALRFPYLRGGEVVNYKFRAHPKTFWMSGGAELVLYGLDDIVGAKEISLVEGEVDKLTMEVAGYTACASVPNGGSGGKPNLDYLSDPTTEAALRGAERILIGTDMDAVGQALADELARRLGPERCLRIHWPEKDANDTLVAHGVEAVQAAVADAQPYPVSGLFTPRELKPALEALYERGFDEGVRAGWPSFDSLYRARQGLLCIVTGVPGSGKSFVLDNLMVRLALTHDWRFAVCSPENQPLERHLAGITAIYQGKPFGDGPTPRMTREELEEARQWTEEHFVFLLPEEPTLANILALADVAVYRLGIAGLVIDPWNELDHTRPPQMTETEHVSLSLTTLRNFSRSRGVQAWLVAHPTKLQKGADGQYPVPTLYDISGSAKFYDKADAGLSVWRNPLDRSIPTEVHVKKVRFRETGQEGVARFRYDDATGQIWEWGQLERPTMREQVAVPWEMSS